MREQEVITENQNLNFTTKINNNFIEIYMIKVHYRSILIYVLQYFACGSAHLFYDRSDHVLCIAYIKEVNLRLTFSGIVCRSLESFAGFGCILIKEIKCTSYNLIFSQTV